MMLVCIYRGTVCDVHGGKIVKNEENGSVNG